MRGTVLVAYLVRHDGRGEAWESERIAGSLLDGAGYAYRELGLVRRTFGWPFLAFLSATLHRLGGRDNDFPFLALQLALSVAVVWLTFRLARRLGGTGVPGAALLAALLAALEPGLVVYGAYKLHETTLAVFLLLLGLEILDRIRSGRRMTDAVSLGAVAGVGVLARGTLAALFVPVVLWGLLERRRRALLTVSVVFVTACLVIAPWTVRNYLVLGRVVLVSTGWSKVFWTGNNPAATGTNLTLGGQTMLGAAAPTFRARLVAADELGREKLYRDAAVQYVRAEPRAFLARTASKLWYFFWFTPTHGRRYEVPVPLAMAHRVFQGVVLLLVVVGVGNLWREGGAPGRRSLMLPLSVVAAVAGLHAITYVEGRHRLLITPILLGLAGHGATGLHGRLASFRARLRPGTRMA